MKRRPIRKFGKSEISVAIPGVSDATRTPPPRFIP
jgi:hypothetical protein